ncbi:hypothetical protein [Kitasatospora sp. MBT63]|uniref:hypothetical protein n=1 Tax=Kitasatospora sp. MBT63 TaxID=1444768 RepID=UPI00053B11E4|nr:hypothetical protein [Kitasatospora sp. MBT63]
MSLPSRVEAVATISVVLVAAGAASGAVLVIDPEPVGVRQALWFGVALPLLLLGVPCGAAVAERWRRRRRIRLTVRRVSGHREEQP